ncbi:MAG: serine protease [Candidatus Omnitrophica bacterium]|nr:serine protease [Candidatus Omnitrophota bacterium]
MSNNFFENQVCHITARILVHFANGDSSIGTGFLHKEALPSKPDKSVILLVSNKHVFSDPTGNIQISFKVKSNKEEPVYDKLEHFCANDFSTIYHPHPDEDVDLACVNISRIDERNIFYKYIYDSFLEPIDFNRTPPGTDVIFVGYPENRYDTIHNLPIIRKGSIASVPSVDYNGRPQIVIDAQVFNGSSGSPVFVSIGGQYRLLGVVSETMIRNAQLQTITPGKSSEFIQQILGLGLVIKQSKVLELISHTLDTITQRITNANQ